MKTILSLLFVFTLVSCQKEITIEVSQPYPQKEPVNPQPANPDVTPADTLPDEIGLNSLDGLFTSDRHYQLVAHYSVSEDLWPEIPEWVKDDIHTLKETGEGIVDYNVLLAPGDTSTKKKKRWIAYADEQGLRFEWLDVAYKPAVFTIEAIEPGTSFVLSVVTENGKLFSKFRRIE